MDAAQIKAKGPFEMPTINTVTTVRLNATGNTNYPSLLTYGSLVQLICLNTDIKLTTWMRCEAEKKQPSFPRPRRPVQIRQAKSNPNGSHIQFNHATNKDNKCDSSMIATEVRDRSIPNANHQRR